MITTKNIIIILPHQDDEIAILPLLDSLEEGVNLKIIFITKNKNQNLNIKRNKESISVLNKIGINDKDIVFLEFKNLILDKHLYKNIKEINKYFLSQRELFTSDKNTTIISTSFEGGHPDHDAAFLISMNIFKKMQYKKFLSFPLYNSEKSFIPFQAFTNLKKYNNQLYFLSFSFKKSLFYFSLIFSYKTQIKTVFFLLPFFIYRCFIKKKFILINHNTNENIQLRPHLGKLLYEKRGWLTFDKFKNLCF